MYISNLIFYIFFFKLIIKSISLINLIINLSFFFKKKEVHGDKNKDVPNT
jgi:hypothetical protein